MKPDFMPGVANRRHLLGEGLEAVTWDEPGGFDIVLGEHLEQASDSDGPGE